VVPLGTTLPKSQESWTQFLKKIPSTYTLVYLIGLGELCFPHLCTHLWKIMNTQKPIICISILNLEQLLVILDPIYDFFSCLFSICTRNGSKLIIKTTKGENFYHLCSWHQSPFKTSQFWFQKFLIKWKLIQSIIYKRHWVVWHLKYFLKINIK
jgi:hypothetical protein